MKRSDHPRFEDHIGMGEKPKFKSFLLRIHRQALAQSDKNEKDDATDFMGKHIATPIRAHPKKRLQMLGIRDESKMNFNINYSGNEEHLLQHKKNECETRFVGDDTKSIYRPYLNAAPSVSVEDNVHSTADHQHLHKIASADSSETYTIGSQHNMKLNSNFDPQLIQGTKSKEFSNNNSYRISNDTTGTQTLPSKETHSDNFNIDPAIDNFFANELQNNDGYLNNIYISLEERLNPNYPIDNTLGTRTHKPKRCKTIKPETFGSESSPIILPSHSYNQNNNINQQDRGKPQSHYSGHFSPRALSETFESQANLFAGQYSSNFMFPNGLSRSPQQSDAKDLRLPNSTRRLEELICAVRNGHLKELPQLIPSRPIRPTAVPAQVKKQPDRRTDCHIRPHKRQDMLLGKYMQLAISKVFMPLNFLM